VEGKRFFIDMSAGFHSPCSRANCFFAPGEMVFTLPIQDKKKHPSLSCDEMNPADVPYNTSPKSYTPHTHTMRTDHP
jgi:hypothetical protein